VVIADGKFTKNKHRAAIRFYTTSVDAIGAEASLAGLLGRVFGALHRRRIAGAA
jgi:hypothetical protein